MRRVAASIRIQKHARAHASRRSYTKLQGAAIVIQTGLRAMAARNEFRRRKQNKAATTIQVVNFGGDRKLITVCKFDAPID